MDEDEELDDGYEPAQFKQKTYEYDLTTSFVEPLQWSTQDVYFIEIKHKITGRVKEKGGPYSFLLADRIMNDLKRKQIDQQYFVTLKKERR